MPLQRSSHNSIIRLVLYKGEVARLPRGHKAVAVREGVAWVTRDGEDAVLRAGEQTDSGRSKFATVVSAIEGPVVIEVLGAGNRRFPAILPPSRQTQTVGGVA